MNTVFCHHSGRGAALVLLHGWGFDHKVWNRLRPILETDFSLYCPDLPGHGKTPPMPAIDFFHELRALLPSTFNLLGWSLGGVYAMKFASLFPAQIINLINVASSPCFLAEKHWPGIHSAVFTRFYQRYSKNPEQTIKEFIQVQSRNSDTMTTIDLPEMGTDLESGLSILQEWDLRKNLSEFKHPVHFLLGKRDSIVPAALAETLLKLYPDFDVELWSQAAHMPFISHQKDFIHYLREVL